VTCSPRRVDPSPIPPRPLNVPGGPLPRLGESDLFPSLDYRVYLAHAAISPVSQPVRRAVDTCLASVAQLGNGAFPMWMAQRERLRTSLSKLLVVDESAVGLSAGCTRSITDVALALPWKKGERLVSYQGEFPANIVPYQQAAELHGGTLELVSLPDPSSPHAGDQILSELERLFRDTSKPTAFLAVSAVQFQSGLLMPLLEMGQLCERYGVYFLVDGIQACGVVPLALDTLRVDAFFCGAHKWLLGLEGSGFCTVSEQLAGHLRPKTAGWLSREHAADFLFMGSGRLRYDQPNLPAPRVFEGSTMNAVGFAALEAGVDIISHLGPGAIFEHIQSLFDYAEPLFVERGFRSLRSPDHGLRSCILSFSPPPDLEITALFAGLERRKIRVSIPDGLLRLAPHFSTSHDHLDLLLDAVDEIRGA